MNTDKSDHGNMQRGTHPGRHILTILFLTRVDMKVWWSCTSNACG